MEFFYFNTWSYMSGIVSAIWTDLSLRASLFQPVQTSTAGRLISPKRQGKGKPFEDRSEVSDGVSYLSATK